MKVFFILSILILSTLAAPYDPDEGSVPSPKVVKKVVAYFFQLVSDNEVFRAVVDIIISMITDQQAKLSSLEEIPAYDLYGFVNDLQEISEFLDNLKRFEELNTENQQCQDISDPNLTCGSGENVKYLRHDLLEGFQRYKQKFEPIVDYLHQAAESAKSKCGGGPEELNAFDVIIFGTQQIKESMAALADYVSSSLK